MSKYGDGIIVQNVQLSCDWYFPVGRVSGCSATPSEDVGDLGPTEQAPQLVEAAQKSRDTQTRVPAPEDLQAEEGPKTWWRTGRVRQADSSQNT